MSQTYTFRHCYIQIFTSNPSHYLPYPIMDPLKISSSSPSKLTQRSAPNCPRRHIHSSFPYYFYSTPSIPNSEGLSAFVSLCESRLSEDSELKVNNNNKNGQTISFNCPPVALATADDLFRDGKLIPSEPSTHPSPLKLPPRLQHVKNIRKSLRGALSFNQRRSASEFTVSKGFDPFAAAMETVRKEDVPWCQISKQHRKAKSCEHMWSDMNPMWEIGNVNIALVGKDEGRGEEQPGGGAWKKIKKRARILNYYFKSAADKLVNYRENHHGATRLDPILEATSSGESTRSNGEDHKLVCSDQRSSKKKSAGIRTLARHTQNHTKQILLAWLGCLRST